MPVHLPRDVELPPEQEINASLLLTKYAHVKTKTENDKSAEIAQRACKGKMCSGAVFHYSRIKGSKVLYMKLQDRLIIDQSGGVQENAHLCLHPHFGTPMIPGSAVKGAARHCLWERWRDAVDANDQETALRYAAELVDLFGFPTGDDGSYKEAGKRKTHDVNLDAWCLENLGEMVRGKNGKEKSLAGKISFFAALPIGPAPLETDVLTCHHPEYYAPDRRKEKATDDEPPNPQFFPVVKAGATFEFVVCSTSRGSEVLADRALEILTSALELNGIGAKTGAGYGWFSVNHSVAEEMKQQCERLDAEAEENRRRAMLSPMEREREELLGVTDFGTAINEVLQSGSDDRKAALIVLLKTEQADYWKDLKKRAKKLPKIKARVDGLLNLARDLGEELP